jgi:hypothetical protein
VLGLILLASSITRRKALTVLVLAGSLVDFSFGVLLQAHVQSKENTAGKSFFSDLEFANGIVRHTPPGPDSLSQVAWQNWFEKHRWALCDRWMRDLPQRHGRDAAFQIVWPVSEAEIVTLKKQDELQWGGWYSRHEGEITYLGDHVIGRLGERVPALVLLALFAGLIATFIKQTPAAGTVPIAKTTKPVPASRKKRSR